MKTDQIAKEILETLGIDSKRIASITLQMAPRKTPVLYIARLMTEEETGELCTILDSYNLVPRDVDID